MNLDQKLKFLNFIQNLKFEKRFLIDYANLISGTFKYQKKFIKKNDLLHYEKNISAGMPILIPDKLSIFNYSNNSSYIYKKNNFLKYMFGLKKKDYAPFNSLSAYGDIYSYSLYPKKKYLKIIKKINFYNNDVRIKIKKLKLKYKTVGAFQTRNIPHFGHEKIIEFYLSRVNHVVINPLIGPKKNDDVNPNKIFLAYKYLKKYYKDKISFLPIIANMFYAGPREAIHHGLLRESFGFTHFSIGRDHAGHGNYYPFYLATKMARKNMKNSKIKLLTHYGSFWHKKRKEIVLCRKLQSKRYLQNISGSEFRNCLYTKKIYKFARIDLQDYLIKNKLF